MQNKYSAVLKKCCLLNVFGSLAVVSMLSLGGLVGDAFAGNDLVVTENKELRVIEYTYDSVTVERRQLTVSTLGNLTVNGATTVKNVGTIEVNSSGKYNAIGNTDVYGTIFVDDTGKYHAIGKVINLFDNSSFKTGEENDATTTLITGATTGLDSYSLVATTLSVSGSSKYTANGITKVECGGSISISGSSPQYGSYDANGATTVSGTASDKGTITVSDYGHYNAFNQTINVNPYGEVRVAGNTVIAEGNKPPFPYSLTAKDLNVSGGTYNAEGNTTISIGATLSVTGGGTYNVGATNTDWISTAISNASAVNSSFNATGLGVLGIYQANMLSVTGTGKLALGTPSLSSGGMGFGADSLLVVHAKNLGTEYALTADRIATTAGAKLLISNVELTDGKATIYIAKCANSSADLPTLTIQEGAWGYDGTNTDGTVTEVNLTTTDSLYFDDAFTVPVAYMYDKAAGTYILTLGIKSSSDVLAGTDVDPTVTAFIDKNKASGTLSKTFKDASMIDDPKEAATTIEGIMKTSVLSGVMSSAGEASNLATGNANARVSLVNATPLGSVESQTFKDVLLADNGTITDAQNPLMVGAPKGGLTNGLALWAQPMFQNVRANGLVSGNYEYGYDTDIYGASLGADYTVDESFRYGLALHVGDGSSKSSNSDFCYAENDFDYFGATLYAGYVGETFSFSADISYTVTRNKLNQETSVGTLYTDDFDATVFSIGTRAEYKFTTDFVDIIPCLGVRINYFETESFDVKDSTETVFHNLASFASTFAVPVGVTFSKSLYSTGIEFFPRASLGVQFTMGDLDVEQKVSGSGTLQSEVFDPATFMGGLGLDAKLDNVTLGLDYNLGASENVTSHQIMATMQYRF